MIGGGDFDLYCKVCGLPFRPIENREDKTLWLNDALLNCSDEILSLKSLESSGSFEINDKTPSKKIMKKLLDNDCLWKDNTVSPYNLLEKHPRSCFLCHSACKYRNDAEKVKKDLNKVKKFQEQYFNDPEFLEKQALNYLLIRPATSTPHPKKVSIESLTVQRLHDVCDIIGIKKGKLKDGNYKKYSRCCLF